MSRKRRTAWVVSSLAALVAAAGWLTYSRTAQAEPDWKTHLDTVHVWTISEESKIPMAVQQAMSRCGEILVLPNWTNKEIGELREIAAKPVDPAASDPEPTWEQFGTLKYRDTVVVVIGERIRARAPIDKSSYADAMEIIFESCESEHQSHRLMGAGVLLYSRLYRRPEIRAKLELMRSDPDPMVALVATSGLRTVDSGKEMDPVLKPVSQKGK
jgi:hypothetical protein